MNQSYSLISIIIPIHNQGDFIGEVVKDYSKALQKLGKPYELILAPNGCSDNTVEVCQRLAQEHEGLQMVVLMEMGWGKTIKRAIEVSRGDLICYVNSARNTGEDLLAVLSKAIENPGSVVQAERETRPNWIRRFASRVYNLECRLLFGFSFKDINGKPKAFPRSLEMAYLRSDDILFDLELVTVSYQQNYPIIEVPIYTWRRHGGKSTTTLMSALQLYLGPFSYKKRQRIDERAFQLQKP